jgi:hypothetical protein
MAQQLPLSRTKAMEIEPSMEVERDLRPVLVPKRKS